MALVPALHLRYKPFSSPVVQSQSKNYSSPLFLPIRSLKNPGTPLIARRRSFRVFNQLEKESIQKTVQDEQEKDVGVRAALTMLRFYKREISPLLPKSCRYVPSCSEYSMEAYKRYGVVKGTILTTWRLCRCNPLGGSGFDPPRWFGEERPPEE